MCIVSFFLTFDCLLHIKCRHFLPQYIPDAVRNAPTVQTFKHRLKTHLFSLTNHPWTWPNIPPGDCPRLRFVHILQHCARYKCTYHYYYYYTISNNRTSDLLTMGSAPGPCLGEKALHPHFLAPKTPWTGDMLLDPAAVTAPDLQHVPQCLLFPPYPGVLDKTVDMKMPEYCSILKIAAIHHHHTHTHTVHALHHTAFASRDIITVQWVMPASSLYSEWCP